MEPKKPRSKTLLFIILLTIVLIAFASYYAVAIMNSDNRPTEVETQSSLLK